MKRTVLLAIGLILSLATGIAQIDGGFYYVQDIFGNLSVVFKGTNVSGRTLRNLSIRCVNEVLKQHKDISIELLPDRNVFEIGIADEWLWMPGEKLYLTYDNGRTVHWIYAGPQTLRPAVPPDGVTRQNRTYLKSRIRQLRYKLKDARRSLRLYERMYDKNPTVTGAMLIMEQEKLILTYESQIEQLERQLYRYL